MRLMTHCDRSYILNCDVSQIINFPDVHACIRAYRAQCVLTSKAKPGNGKKSKELLELSVSFRKYPQIADLSIDLATLQG